jgi:ATP diphosphatase
MSKRDPSHSRAESGVLDRALHLVRFLRAGCPWDAAQTPVSLTPYLLEESLELADAILDAAEDAKLLAEERGAFTSADVVRTLEEKMRRRHPHLYGDAEQRPHWEAEKANERASNDVFHGLASRLDPLARAQRVQDRAAGVGFDWDHAKDAFAKVHEEANEVSALLDSNDQAALEAELGDLLFAVVNVARLSKLHAATALRLANRKFERRFARLQELAEERGLRMGQATLAQLDELWEEIKRRDEP